MRIRDLARKDGRAGSEGSWKSQTFTFSNGVEVREIYHYGHHMLSFRITDPSDTNYLDYSIGWGSVSDQGGMNQLFLTLGLPYYYSRLGGASIDRLSYEEIRVP